MVKMFIVNYLILILWRFINNLKILMLINKKYINILMNYECLKMIMKSIVYKKPVMYLKQL